MEQRHYEFENLELRDVSTDGDEGQSVRRLIGYAAVFGEPAKLRDFQEVILPGAFKRSMDENDIRALHEHDRKQLLGRTSANTLRLKEDAHGLRVEIDLPETSYAADIASLVERGDMRGMSFGFKPYEDGERWFVTEDGIVTRELSSINLREVTTTSIPAYAGTELALRSHDEVDPDAIKMAQGMKNQQDHNRLTEARRKYRQAQAAI